LDRPGHKNTINTSVAFDGRHLPGVPALLAYPRLRRFSFFSAGAGFFVFLLLLSLAFFSFLLLLFLSVARAAATLG